MRSLTLNLACLLWRSKNLEVIRDNQYSILVTIFIKEFVYLKYEYVVNKADESRNNYNFFYLITIEGAIKYIESQKRVAELKHII